MGNMPTGSTDSAISGVNCDHIRCEEWLYLPYKKAIQVHNIWKAENTV